MSNQFERLARELADVERQTDGVEQLIEHAMASRLLCLFLGWDWYQGKIAFRDDPDEWMQNRKRDSGITRVVYNHRVVRLGDAIFTLLKARVKGIGTLRQRFLTRPTKPCFMEAEIASLLVFSGFDVEIITETGVRGDDFDFTATKNRTTLSIEVTAKEAGPLTIETIRNTLRKKRTQVPPHRPAVLFMHVPAEWMEDLPKAQGIFTEAFVKFFGRSRRFNAIILVWERVVPFMHGGFPHMSFWPCYNNSSRHPYSHIQLLGPTKAPDGRIVVACSFLAWLRALQAKILTSEGRSPKSK